MHHDKEEDLHGRSHKRDVRHHAEEDLDHFGNVHRHHEGNLDVVMTVMICYEVEFRSRILEGLHII